MYCLQRYGCSAAVDHVDWGVEVDLDHVLLPASPSWQYPGGKGEEGGRSEGGGRGEEDKREEAEKQMLAAGPWALAGREWQNRI